MQRDILLLTEMIDAAEQAQQLTAGRTVSQLETDRQRRDALLWNFTVLGEAAGQLSAEVKDRFPDVAWQQPMRLRNRIVHGYWSIDVEVLHTTATEQLPAFTADLRSVLSCGDASSRPSFSDDCPWTKAWSGSLRTAGTASH